MSRKTNKTTHVLNLLSNGVKRQEDSTPEENTEKTKGETENPEAGQSKQETVEKASGVSVVHRGKDAVADLIKESLEEELQAEEKEETKDQEAKKPEAKEPETKKAETEKNSAGKPEAKEPETKKAEPAAVPEPEEEFVTVNVMERLVKERAPKYIRQFHLCECRRCLADVTALALTGLPAKYVVVNKNAVSPLMNFYTVKFAGLITVEVTKACMIVQANPHHSIENTEEKG